MANIFPECTVHERYDLKGSWVDRSAAETPSSRYCHYCHARGDEVGKRGFCEQGPTTQHDFGVVLKDNDFQLRVRLCCCCCC
jgi:hypothetical protein